MAQRVLGYDLKKPYKMIVSHTGNLVIQNGIVYEVGSGKALGPVSNMLKAENPNILYCKQTGATFPNTEAGKLALEEYQERKGLIQKESTGKEVKASTLDERKQEVANRRDKIVEGKKHK